VQIYSAIPIRNNLEFSKRSSRRITMKRFFWGTLGLIAMAAPALAADLPVKAPPPMIPPMFNWSGFYIGADGGWGRSDSCWTTVTEGLPLIEGCHDRSGGVVGGQIGYRWQQPGSHFVWGLEAQGDWANLRGSRLSFFDPTLTVGTKVDAIGLFTGQFGFAWDTWLWYVKTGFAVTNNNFFVSDSFTGASASASSTRWGGAVGTGFEYAFAPNWSVGFEYDHLFMGAKDTIFPGVVNPLLTGAIAHIDQAVDMVTIRFNYRFGGYGYGGGPVVARY
jgi:outer membrane immunogenic protein